MKKIILMASVLFAMTACSVEDEGSYTYTELNSVSIEDIESSYSKLSKVDNLTITPKLTGSLSGENLDDYEYHWYVCQGLHEHTTISQEKDLDWKVDLPAGAYSIYFTVKDKATGLEWIESTSLSVTTSYTKGFLLLGDDENGEVRMDMIVMPSGRDTTVAERIYANEEHATNAQSIIFTGPRMAPSYPYRNQSLYLSSEVGTMKLTSSASLAAEKEYSEFTKMGTVEGLGIILTEFDIKRPIVIKDMFPRMSGGGAMKSSSSRGLITEDFITVSSITQGEYYSVAINRYNANSKDLFKPYPLAFVRGANQSFSGTTVFYDMDADQFVGVNNTMFLLTTHCNKLYDYSNDIFKWNAASEGRKLVHGENGNNANLESYAIMKDGEGNYYIYVFIVNSTSLPTKRAIYNIDLSMATGFDKASHYAFSSAKTVVLYSVGSTLYAYDFSRKQITSMDLGAEITCLEEEFQSAGSRTDIIVATFNDASKTGTVRKLAVGGGNDAVELTEKPREIWDITLKVKDIEWKYSN